MHFPAVGSAGRQPDHTIHQAVTRGLAAAGRHPRPSRFSLDRSTLRRLEGSAGAAEGLPPGEAAAAPRTGLSLDAVGAWHSRWHAALNLSPVHFCPRDRTACDCLTADVLMGASGLAKSRQWQLAERSLEAPSPLRMQHVQPTTVALQDSYAGQVHGRQPGLQPGGRPAVCHPQFPTSALQAD